MIRKIVLSFLALMVSAAALAQALTASQAMERAKMLLKGKTLAEVRVTDKKVAATRGGETEAYYVFNALEGGFAVIAGDEHIDAVLAYSPDGHFGEGQLPGNVAAWLSVVTRQIEALRSGEAEAKMITRAPSSHEPLMDFAWCQWDPFRMDCKVTPDGMDEQQCFPGCVATAMAQLIYYHAKKSDAGKVACKALPSYTYNFYDAGSNSYVNTTVPALEATTFDWDNMRGYYKKSDIDGAAPKAVAKLMHYCAVAVEAMFGTDETLAYDSKVIKAMTNYFGYPDNIQFVRSKDYAWDEFENLLRTEIEAGRPVLYAADNTLGPGGHDLIVDGWDADGRFHVNWGWDRQGEGKGKDNYNGYFMLTEMVVPNVPDQAYNGNPVAFLNFAPAESSGITATKAESCSEQIYDLQGHKLTVPPTRGVYIQGGKKRMK